MTYDSFRSHFLNYFRNGQLNKTDKLLSRLSPRFIFRNNAIVISEAYKKLESPVSGYVPVEISIEKYSGNNPVAKKIAELLQHKALEQLLGAYAHGSVGTSEETGYSDFDGLVIIKNSCLENPQMLFNLVVVLKEAEQIMREMDPLQHHGWFVLSEADLKDYPEHYFPHILFKHAKCLFGSTRLHIAMRADGYQHELKQSFNRLSKSIQRKLQSKKFLENYYVFKNLLSEFMLMPAIYIQAKTGSGIFKKFSFEMLEKEAGEKYRVMNEVSAIRKNWNYQPSEKYPVTPEIRNVLSAQHYAGNSSGILSEELKNKFDDEMIGRMNDLVNNLQERLQS